MALAIRQLPTLGTTLEPEFGETGNSGSLGYARADSTLSLAHFLWDIKTELKRFGVLGSSLQHAVGIGLYSAGGTARIASDNVLWYSFNHNLLVKGYAHAS